jgi:hypothetical protein
LRLRRNWPKAASLGLSWADGWPLGAKTGSMVRSASRKRQAGVGLRCGSRRRRAGSFGFSALILGFVGLILSGGNASAAEGKAGHSAWTSESLFKTFGTDEARVDFVALIDTSGSMRGARFSAVRAALCSLVRSVGAGDGVSVIRFDRDAQYLVAPHRFEGPSEAKAYCELFSSLPEPKAGRQPGDWGATDVGEGIERALVELSKPTSRNLEFLFVLTDGIHEPTRQTRYRPGEEKPWNELAARAKDLLDSKEIEVAWLWFAPALSTDRVRKVFPSGVPLILPAAVLPQYFDRLREELRARKLRAQIAAELRGAAWTGGTAPKESIDLPYWKGAIASVDVRSKLRRLPVTTELKEARVTAGPAVVPAVPAVSPGSVILGPGEAATFKIHLRHEKGSFFEHLFLCYFGAKEGVPIDIEFDASSQAEPATLLQQMATGQGLRSTAKHRVRLSARLVPRIRPFMSWFLTVTVGLLGTFVFLVKANVLRGGRLMGSLALIAFAVAVVLLGILIHNVTPGFDRLLPAQVARATGEQK